MREYTDTDIEELLEQNKQLKKTIALVEENKASSIKGYKQEAEYLKEQNDSLHKYIQDNREGLTTVEKLLQQVNELEKELSDKEEEHERQLKSLKLKTNVLEALGYTEKDLEVFSKIRWLGYEEGYDDARGGW